MIEVYSVCPFCGKEQVTLVPKEGLMKWQAGTTIQRALPGLTADEREALMTGICDTCFPKDED